MKKNVHKSHSNQTITNKNIYAFVNKYRDNYQYTNILFRKNK